MCLSHTPSTTEWQTLYDIAKKQSLAGIYPEELRTLRQCGDIDVIVWKDNVSFEASKKLVTKFAQQIDPKIKCGIHHICFDDWNGITLELHFVSSYFCNPIKTGYIENGVSHSGRIS